MPTSHPSLADAQLQKLKPGDRVQVTQRVRVGGRQWQTTIAGTVVEARRRLTSLHTDRAPDDKVYVDTLLLRRDDGDLTTLTLDERTELDVPSSKS